MISTRRRTAIPKSVQLDVYFRDGWLCRLCRRPTLFPLTFKLLAETVSANLPGVSVAIWNPNWRRDQAPLLDELAASIDHVQAFSSGGAHDISNFATICARCNARKSARTEQEFRAVSRPWLVKGKHGEPQHWDGLVSLFVVHAKATRRSLTMTEKQWLNALEAYYAKVSP